MTATRHEYITLGGQMGDREAYAAVSPYSLKLRKLLAEKCCRGYGPNFREMAYVLRVDGTGWHWEKSGCAGVRVTKSGAATVDIYMPVDVWKAGGASIRNFLAEHVKQGFELMLSRLISKKISLDSEGLSADFMAAVNEFLNTP